MKKLAEEGLRAWEGRTAQPWLSAVARYGRAMASLGRDAGVPVVTEELDAIMRYADESKVAAAKPSGAGGGDVAVLFALDPETPQRIAEKAGCALLEVAVDRRGLSRR
jgi:mevalonate kinase